MRAIPVWKLSAVSCQLSEPWFQGGEEGKFPAPNPFLSNQEGDERCQEPSPACC